MHYICWKCNTGTDRPARSTAHIGQGYCEACAGKAQRRKFRRERDRMFKDLGLIKVRGAASGRTYYE